jgi:hypothetical protein
MCRLLQNADRETAEILLRSLQTFNDQQQASKLRGSAT